MNEILHRRMVLVLNRNWQAVNTTTPAAAFCQLAADAAMALDVRGEQDMAPVAWAEWIGLPVRNSDQRVMTVRGPIRVPTVVISRNFNQVPMRRPGLSARAIRVRDHSRCQYTGKHLGVEEGNIDHVVPKSRGGDTSWTNCVWSCREINNRKGDRTPDEAGLRLLRHPEEPRPIPVTLTLTNPFAISDWDPFLMKL